MQVLDLSRCLLVLLGDGFNGGLLQKWGVFRFSPTTERHLPAFHISVSPVSAIISHQSHDIIYYTMTICRKKEEQQSHAESNQTVRLFQHVCDFLLTRACQGTRGGCKLSLRCPESGSSWSASPGSGMGGTQSCGENTKLTWCTPENEYANPCKSQQLKPFLDTLHVYAHYLLQCLIILCTTWWRGKHLSWI